MKILLVFVLLVMSVSDVYALEFSGQSYVVMETESKNVIESYNQNHTQSVASISKIMTAIIAIENGKMNDVYTIGDEVNDAWGSGVYIHTGDKITLCDLLYGVLLRSGNDACLTLAKNIAGDVETFVDMMNSKAKELGMNNTVFSNPTGLDEEDNGNVSSAYDMALLMSYCSLNPIFNDIVSTKEYVRKDGNGIWHNKNRLLSEYKYCVGGKTGYTKKAKRTLVTRAIKDGVSFVIVTLNCGNDFEFHKNKYEECFEKYKKYLIFPKGIYNYNGHSFVIDEDLFFYKKEDALCYIDHDRVVLLAGYNKLKEVYSESFIHCLFSYMRMLLGDCFG